MSGRLLVRAGFEYSRGPAKVRGPQFSAVIIVYDDLVQSRVEHYTVTVRGPTIARLVSSGNYHNWGPRLSHGIREVPCDVR